MMKRLLLALAVLWPACAQAQAWATRAACDVPAAAATVQAMTPEALAGLRREAAAVKNGAGRFWRIQSPEGAVSHLWGTFPSNHPLILDLPQIVQDRVAAAGIVAVETDFTAPSRAVFDTRLHPGGVLRPAPVDFTRSGLDASTRASIRGRTAGLGLGEDAPDWLTLGGLAELLMLDPCEDFAAGVIPLQATRIQMLGLIGGAEILGLEPPEVLTAQLDLPQNRQAALSLLTVLGARLTLAAPPADRAGRFALYRQGEIAALMAWEAADLAALHGEDTARMHLSSAYGFLLAARNARFLQAALPALQQGGTFLSIGAFHLPGETGMIEALRRAGFTLSRIPLPGEPAG